MTRTVLTGIKPTGTPHLGNLLGAIRPALRLAGDPALRAFYFIADYHALTTVRDRGELARLTREVAATWLAFGLDAERVLFYRQSDIPEIFELAWILACFTPKGWMNKAHAYKARVAANELAGNPDLDAGIGMGLYEYPILMAADILVFEADLVPVGEDQKQHVEIARDIAQRINHAYGAELLKLPSALIDAGTAVIPGRDGRKMSKSYDNVISLFAPPAALRKQVNSIVTDSTPPELPKDPATSVVFKIFEQFAPPDATAALRQRYQDGIAWGEAKAALFAVLEPLLAEPRERYQALIANPGRIDEVLAAGRDRARALAGPVIGRLRSAIGIAA
ncbi:MAG TPA: tryptophan--tRNA ligase [Kofleriaceae bacterium]|jgi:tryptophanyl-tRNA synthetase|nr:tryptophan--tRNA ligase [Kofleriaceae bacterium]